MMNTRMVLWATFFFLWGVGGKAQDADSDAKELGLRALLLMTTHVGGTLIIQDDGRDFAGDVIITRMRDGAIKVEYLPGRGI